MQGHLYEWQQFPGQRPSSPARHQALHKVGCYKASFSADVRLGAPAKVLVNEQGQEGL